MYREPFIWNAENYWDEYFNFLISNGTVMLWLLKQNRLSPSDMPRVLFIDLQGDCTLFCPPAPSPQHTEPSFPAGTAAHCSESWWAGWRLRAEPSWEPGVFVLSPGSTSESAGRCAHVLSTSLSPPSPPLPSPLSLPVFIKMKTVG